MVKRSTQILFLTLLMAGDLSRSHAVMPATIGPDGLGMGGAYATQTTGTSSLFWNPAGISEIIAREITGMFSRDYFDTRSTFFAYGQPLPEFGGIAAGWSRVASDFEKTGTQDDILGTGTAANDVFMLGVGYYGIWPLSLGVTGKFVHEQIDTFSLSGMSADFGLLFTAEPLSIAVVGENIVSSGLTGSSVTGGDVEEKLPQALRLGIAFSGQTLYEGAGTDGSEPVRLRGTIAGDVRIPSDRNEPATFSPGAEVWVNNTVAFRAGMREGKDYTTGISLSIGKLRLDYVFLFSRDLENTHAFSTSFFF